MRVKLAYGKHGLTVDLPHPLGVHVIRKRPLRPLANPQAAVARALTTPAGSPPLAALAKGKSSACVLICDITRPVPNHLFLQPMIRELMHAGIPANGITVLVATGLHRPNLGDELSALVGDPWVLENVEVVNHDARDSAAHEDLGFTTTRGTPIKLDKRFVGAELRIATGLVEPHFMAGYSGGRKVITPGVAHEDTIRTLHNAQFMEHPDAIQCNLRGNPLHEEQLEAVGMLGPTYGLNTVVDERRRLAFVNFGEVVASHLEAVAFAASACTVPVARRFDTLVTSAAGHPLDRTYYQTVKGMVTPMDVLAPGADLIIASECSEGLGSNDFRQAQQRLKDLGSAAFLGSLRQKPLADVDEWQTEMQLKPMRSATVYLYTDGLGEDERALTGVNLIDSIEEAVQQSVERSRDPAVAVIPEGPYVVPVYAAPGS